MNSREVHKNITSLDLDNKQHKSSLKDPSKPLIGHCEFVMRSLDFDMQHILASPQISIKNQISSKSPVLVPSPTLGFLENELNHIIRPRALNPQKKSKVKNTQTETIQSTDEISISIVQCILLISCLLSFASSLTLILASAYHPSTGVLLIGCNIVSLMCALLILLCNKKYFTGALNHMKYRWRVYVLLVLIIVCLLNVSHNMMIHTIIRFIDILITAFIIYNGDERIIVGLASELVVLGIGFLTVNRKEYEEGSYELKDILYGYISHHQVSNIGIKGCICIICTLSLSIFIKIMMIRCFSLIGNEKMKKMIESYNKMKIYIYVYKILQGEPDAWIEKKNPFVSHTNPFASVIKYSREQISPSIGYSTTDSSPKESAGDDGDDDTMNRKRMNDEVDINNIDDILLSVICTPSTVFIFDMLNGDDGVSISQKERLNFEDIANETKETMRSDISINREVSLKRLWSELYVLLQRYEAKITIDYYKENEEIGKTAGSGENKSSLVIVSIKSGDIQGVNHIFVKKFKSFIQTPTAKEDLSKLSQLMEKEEDVMDEVSSVEEYSFKNVKQLPEDEMIMDSDHKDVNEEPVTPSLFIPLKSDDTHNNVRCISSENSPGRDYISLVVHEMRSPLNCILGNLELMNYQLSYHEKYSSIRPLIRSSIASSSMLETLINDILDSERISKGIFKMDVSKMNLHETINECITTLEMAAKARGNQITLDYEGIETIRSDRVRIKQVIINLLSNSVKFTSRGKIEVVVRDTPKCKKITVRDNGKGISTGLLENLFQKYHSNRKLGENTNGLGIGLYICKSIVSYLGPNDVIEVCSMENVETEFSFEIFTEMNDNGLNEVRPQVESMFELGTLGEERVSKVNNYSKARSGSNEISVFNLNNQFLLNNSRQWPLKFNQIKENPKIEESLSMFNFRRIENHDRPKFSSFYYKHAQNFMSDIDCMKSASAIPVSLKNITRTNLKTQAEKDCEVRSLFKTIEKQVLRVLLVDDDPFITDMLKDFFIHSSSQLDISVNIDTADTVRDAISSLSSSSYDLVFVDFNLPDGTAIDIVNRFGSEVSRPIIQKSSPLFVLSSGVSTNEIDKNSLEEYFYKILEKPVSLEKFKNLLEKVIKITANTPSSQDKKIYPSDGEFEKTSILHSK